MTRSQKRYLNAEEVVELASLLDDAPRRIGLVDEVLQAAAEGRGMTLSLDRSEAAVDLEKLDLAAILGLSDQI